MVYQPEEDSYFLSNALSDYLKLIKKENLANLKFLDLGSGSGIQAETASEFIPIKNILCSDMDVIALNQARKKGFPIIKSNLFSKIKSNYDLIAFNPPYLPKEKFDSKPDTSGGKKGDEIIVRFLKQARNHLAENGKIFLLLSSFTPKTRILKELDRQDFSARLVAQKKLFFESLEVWEIY